MDLLRSGAVMETQFQVFEAHISFYMQFSTDFNAMGMNNVFFSHVAFRSLPTARNPFFAGHNAGQTTSTLDMPLSERVWLADAETKVECSPFSRQTTCELEMDAQFDAIMNRDDILPQMGTQSSAFLDTDVQLIHSLAEIVAEEKEFWPPDVFARISAEPHSGGRFYISTEMEKHGEETRELLRAYLRENPVERRRKKDANFCEAGCTQFGYSVREENTEDAEDDLDWLQNFGEKEADGNNDGEKEAEKKKEEEEKEVEEDRRAIEMLSQMVVRKEKTLENDNNDDDDDDVNNMIEDELSSDDNVASPEIIPDHSQVERVHFVVNEKDHEVAMTDNNTIIISSDTQSKQESQDQTPKVKLPFFVPCEKNGVQTFVYNEPFPFFEENFSSSAKHQEATQSTQITWSTQTAKNKTKATNRSLEVALQRAHSMCEDNNQHLTLACTEIQVMCRKGFVPDSEQDAIQAVCLLIRDDDAQINQKQKYRNLTYFFIVGTGDEDDAIAWSELNTFAVVQFFPTELEMIKSYVAQIRVVDPDIMCAYTSRDASYNYLCQRAKILGYDANTELSRVVPRLSTNEPNKKAPEQDNKEQNKRDSSRNWYSHHCVQRIPGRITIDVWLIARMNSRSGYYTLHNLAAELLGWRIPRFSHGKRTSLWKSKKATVVLTYLSQLCEATILLLDAFNTIQQTSETARFLGLDFQSVIERGSQLRIESVLIRLTRARGFLMQSCTRADVRTQRPLECSPLSLEPPSRFNRDPVVVLDFQSLYPSIIVAYNLCYSTCLGRIPKEALKRRDGLPITYQFGCGQYTLTPENVESAMSAEKGVFVARNGVAFVRPEVRLGILPRMVSDILRTRILVKRAMKQKGCTIGRVQMEDARQMSLKMVCNFVYGYASASFSGRMPCVDLSDAIVECSRATVERAIRLVEATSWDDKPEHARVIYGNTDSIFVELPGRTLSEAFAIGKKIEDTVTRDNPIPVTLKFEKVYQPCILMAKNRYVGYKYETPPTDGEPPPQPVLEEKGTEVVRRDSCGVVRKILDRTVRTYFDASLRATLEGSALDMPRLHAQFLEYLARQLQKIEVQRISISDFIFAREVRLGTYAPGRLPPAAVLATAKASRDQKAAPMYGDRVQYVIVSGMGSVRGGEGGRGSAGVGGVGIDERLVDLVAAPRRVAKESALAINTEYYIVRQVVPSLQRMLTPAVGLDVAAWYRAQCRLFGRRLPPPALMPDGFDLQTRAALKDRNANEASTTRQMATIDMFFRRGNCVNCGDATAPAAPTPKRRKHPNEKPDKRGEHETNKQTTEHENLQNGVQLCVHCARGRNRAVAEALVRRDLVVLERKLAALAQECSRCVAGLAPTKTTQTIRDIEEMCSSTECVTWFKRLRATHEVLQMRKTLGEGANMK